MSKPNDSAGSALLILVIGLAVALAGMAAVAWLAWTIRADVAPQRVEGRP